MRSYKRSVKNNKKRTRRSFIKKKITQINRRTKKIRKKIKANLRGGESNFGAEARKEHPKAAAVGAAVGGFTEGALRGMVQLATGAEDPMEYYERTQNLLVGERSCILMARRLAELYGKNIDKFLEIKQKVNDLSLNVGISKSVKDSLLTEFLKELNGDLETSCSKKDINYENITEIIELFKAIEMGEIETPKKKDKQSWSEWVKSFSDLELFGKNPPKTFNPREPIEPIL